jgi:16S rRNA (uracil1498-N3)-methyltransferase
MRISRLFTEQPLAPGAEVLLDEGASHYVLRVLRLGAGDPLVLFNGDGFDYAGQIAPAEGRGARIILGDRLPAASESPLTLTLVQAVSRGERMDQTLQKATELGVAAIQPILTERVEVRLGGRRLEKRERHWLGVIRSACEQSGRGRVPALLPLVTLDEWLGRTAQALRLALHPGAADSLASQPVGSAGVELLVGPEGGLSGSEVQRIEAGNVVLVRLGPRVLRTETAGPAALAVLQARGGDF